MMIERRQHPRTHCRIPVLVEGTTPAGRIFRFRGWLADISGGGVRLIAPQEAPVENGQRIRLHLIEPEPIDLGRGTVAWMTFESGSLTLGIMMDDLLCMEHARSRLAA